MKKIYKSPNILVVKLTSKHALLQTSLLKGEGDFDSENMVFTREYDNSTISGKNVWDDEW